MSDQRSTQRPGIIGGNESNDDQAPIDDLPVGCPAVIAVVTDALYPHFMGGKEVLYHYATTGLADRGIEVHMYSMHWWDGRTHTVKDKVHYHALCRVFPLYHGTRRSIFEAVMFAIACLRLMGQDYDLIYADHMPHLQLFTIRLVSKIRRVPLVVTWHEVWGSEYWRSYLGPLGIVAAAIEHLAMKLADHVVAVSTGTAQQLRQHGIPSNRITVIPNGVDLVTIASATPSRHFDFLYVGRFLEHKRINHLIEGIAALRTKGKTATCGIVGDGPEHQSLIHLSSELGVDDLVTFLPTLPDQSEIFGLMKAATALVLPSVREGFGIVAAEALACGLPVITTNHPENRAQDLVEDGVSGWICPPTSAGITEALRDALEGTRSRVPSKKASSPYDWRAVVTRLIEVFTTAAN